jgi:hypothetical protein
VRDLEIELSNAGVPVDGKDAVEVLHAGGLGADCGRGYRDGNGLWSLRWESDTSSQGREQKKSRNARRAHVLFLSRVNERFR